jgi:hypothetical protein
MASHFGSRVEDQADVDLIRPTVGCQHVFCIPNPTVTRLIPARMEAVRERLSACGSEPASGATLKSEPAARRSPRRWQPGRGHVRLGP